MMSQGCNIHYSILSCFIFMVHYRKDSRPRRIFTSEWLISATCAQALRMQFQSQPIFGPPVNFPDLISHLLIIHEPLFSRQNKSVTTSLLTNKLYPDLIRARKRRICPSFKCRRVSRFSQKLTGMVIMGNRVMG